MQSADQVERIVQNKVNSTSNQKTLKDMQSAINDINKETKIDKMYAIVGLLIFVPVLYYCYQYFFV